MNTNTKKPIFKAIVGMSLLLVCGSAYSKLGQFTEGYCTYGVDQHNGFNIDWTGDAWTWFDGAKALGYKVKEYDKKFTPIAGSIIVFGTTYPGHVAVVDKDPLYMNEMNGGDCQGATANNFYKCVGKKDKNGNLIGATFGKWTRGLISC